jgi:hypothetical protein
MRYLIQHDPRSFLFNANIDIQEQILSKNAEIERQALVSFQLRSPPAED